MALPSVAEREARIRAYAVSIGMDPDIAAEVARGEGLRANTWQSELMQPYGREQSYGDFQLHYDPTGKRPGLGNEFVEKTGLDVSDPANWWEMNKFGLDKARQDGWGAWMGAKAKGITGFMGIGGQPAEAPQAFPARPTDTVAQPGAGAMPDPVAGLLDVSPSQADPTFMDSMEDMAPTAGKIIDKAKKKRTAEPLRPLMDPVLMPLKKYTLEGLL